MKNDNLAEWRDLWEHAATLEEWFWDYTTPPTPILTKFFADLRRRLLSDW